MTEFENSWRKEDLIRLSSPRPHSQAAGFEDLVERYHKLVMSLIQRYYGGRLSEHAEDLSQEIWVKLWTAFKKNEKNVINFKSYLYRTVQTTLWDAIRSNHLSNEDVEDHPDSASSSGEDELHAKMTLSHILRGLKPEETRMVRAYLQGFNNSEIATLLGCSEGRVRNLLSRLKKKMALVEGE